MCMFAMTEQAIVLLVDSILAIVFPDELLIESKLSDDGIFDSPID
jgi:hypothetical protein